MADKAEPAPDAAKNTEPVEPARDSEKPVKDAESPAKDSAKSDTSDEAPAKQGSAKRAPEAGKAPAALTVRLYPRKVKLYPGGRAVVSAWTCPADDRSPFGKDRVPGTRDDECSAVRAKWSVKDPVRAHLSNQVGYKTRITLDKLKKTKLIAQYDGMERRARVLVKDAPAKVRPAAEAASKAPKSTKAPEAEATKAAPDPLAEESTEVVAEAAAQAVEPSPEPSVEPTLDPAADTTPALTAPTPDPSEAPTPVEPSPAPAVESVVESSIESAADCDVDPVTSECLAGDPATEPTEAPTPVEPSPEPAAENAAEPTAEPAPDCDIDPVTGECLVADPTPELETAPEPSEAPAAADPVSRAFAPAANEITVKDHAGQRPNGSWTSGNVSGYSEGDTVNFRFTLEATAPGAGTFDIRYTATAGCQFFEPTFGLGNTGAYPMPPLVPAGPDPTVTLGSNTVDGNDRIQVVNVQFAAAGAVTAHYYLTLAATSGACSSSGSSAIDGETGDVQVSGQQTVPVSGTITALPEISVLKQIDEDGDGNVDRTAAAGEYEFCLTPAPSSHPSPDDCLQTDASGSVEWINVSPSGSYDIDETQVDFSNGTYQFVSGSGVNCTFNGETATVDVAAGRPATGASCVFVNEVVPGNIIVEKVTDPNGDPTLFDFSADWDADGFQLADGDSEDSGDLTPGTYAVSEAVPDGWALDSATCDDGSDPGAITLDSGETVTCTFTNVQHGTIIVEKDTDPAGDLTAFDSSSIHG